MGEEAAVEEGWLEIQALRKEGRFSDAIDRGLALLEMHASDKRVRSQVDWAFHGQVKQMAGGIAARAQSSEPVARADIDALVNEVRRFARLPKRRPDRAVSLILLELARIAPHLPTFPGMVRWVGLDGLADEDWQYQKRNEREFSPIGLRVARGLAKWAKEHGDASPDDLTLTVSWLERARSVARGDDALWLDWDGASLYRRVNRGDDAATCLTHVVKAKQREFWVWAEASRLYSEARPDLAIACACRALECGADEKFLVKVHQELAVLLARGEAYAQASHEIAIAAGIRAKNGWKADATLRELVESAWYDPS
ncbi:MAG: hypothetical protein EB084_22995, partial [Proteobacteria bacterium]|nr:hypothetical protein [Pseudomonadota bacterium]